MHVRLRDNAEPVAFYGGIHVEGALIESKFGELLRHRLRLLRTQWKFNMTQVSLQPRQYASRCPLPHYAAQIASMKSPYTLMGSQSANVS